MDNPVKTDNLISQNPRDEIILLREKKLHELKEAKKLRALYAYNEILEKFSNQFFRDDAAFDKLTLLQKKELAKFCASHCLRWLASWILPIGSSLAAILSLGIFSSSGWLLMLVPWTAVSLVSFIVTAVRKDTLRHVNFEHFWPFLRAYRKMNQALPPFGEKVGRQAERQNKGIE